MSGARALLAGVLLAWASGTTWAGDAQASQLLGNWLTEPRTGIIQISQLADGSYQGRIVGGSTPHRLDEKNPDAARRGALLLGQVIMRAMHYDGAGQWGGGSIYDPDSGHTYRCHLELLPGGQLKVRGYIGISLLGRTQVWTRYTSGPLDLSSPH